MYIYIYIPMSSPCAATVNYQGPKFLLKGPSQSAGIICPASF